MLGVGPENYLKKEEHDRHVGETSIILTTRSAPRRSEAVPTQGPSSHRGYGFGSILGAPGRGMVFRPCNLSETFAGEHCRGMTGPSDKSRFDSRCSSHYMLW